MAPTVRAVELELDNFKSFGKKTRIPLGEGFTTISGPNGSGKSNILDAIMFVLGLTTSKALRAERLPDLINNRQTDRRTASVSLRLSVEPETDEEAPDLLEISRVIRVNDENYSSTYYLNGRVSPLSKIHEEISKLKISPAGHNIILQGDVTRITTLSPLERRRIIDDLAGVAEFDSRIDAARAEMDKASRHMENLSIVSDEIKVRLNELEAEKEKALTYQALRERKAELEAILIFAERNDVRRKLRAVDRDIEKIDAESKSIGEMFPALSRRLDAAREELDKVESEIRAKGEDEKLAKLQELEETKGAIQRNEEAMGRLRQQMGDLERSAKGKEDEIERAKSEVASITGMISSCRGSVTELEKQVRDRQRELKELYGRLENINTEQAGQAEKLADLRGKSAELKMSEGRAAVTLEAAGARLQEQRTGLEQARQELGNLETRARDLRQIIEDAKETRQALVEDVDKAQRKVDGNRWESNRARQERNRLEQEFRELYRSFTREEAKAKVASQVNADIAVKTVLESGIKGIRGTVASLVSVPPEFQTATEIAAGRRLNHIVVDDENVAGRCIQLLKEKKAGRVTFIPLNKIRGRAPDHLLKLEGTRGYLIDLLNFKDRYEPVFAYVFGSTVLVETIERASQLIGQFRMVTLDGELFEKSGAITGGHISEKRKRRFAIDLEGMRRKLKEKEEEGRLCAARLDQLDAEESKLVAYLEQAKKNLADLDMDILRDEAEAARVESELSELKKRVKTLCGRVQESEAEKNELEKNRKDLLGEIEALDIRIHNMEEILGAGDLENIHRNIAELEQSIRRDNDAIRENQERIRLGELELAYHNRNIDGWSREITDIAQRRVSLEREVVDVQDRIRDLAARRNRINESIAGLTDEIREFRSLREERIKSMEAIREERLELEANIRACRERRLVVDEKKRELVAREAELDDELADRPQIEDKVPKSITPGKIKREIAEKEQAMIALEPVNMLALEQHSELLARSEELAAKLGTLNEEKRELKRRMTMFGRQKYEAFMATFRQVQENYVKIYEELSDGEGELVLDNEDDPFAGGLAIKARPRGKKMERLEALSGGEKSLSALAFVFAFQSHDPAPFYVFDEVDMFLDGSNTERLADMLRRQAATTQFLVVSLRKAMLERSHRTIGVTQTRKGFSEVTGLELQRFSQKENEVEYAQG